MFKYVHVKQAFWKALIASIFFIIVYMFYNNEIVRAKIEDIAFDIVNKFSIKTTPVKTDSPEVLLFAIDDLYMKEHGLYDEYNKSNYGYSLPRGHIATFIETLDELALEIEFQNLPRALFIDYDMSFTTLPYGKELSVEDMKLLEVLKKPRHYTILLPKTDYYNFIEQSKDREIQRAIKEKRIIFVSVSFLLSSDDVVRRYQGYKYFLEDNGSKGYKGAGIALWEMLSEEQIEPDSSNPSFYRDDIIGNRIWLKSYKSFGVEDGCSVQKSYWENLTKYSANCSLFDIVEEDFSGAILMLGGTHTQNDDNFDTLNVIKTESFFGMDIHANTLMTILHLDGSMKRLEVWYGFIIVFLSFFSFSLLISIIFSLLNISKKGMEFIILLMINTVLFIVLSIYFLNEHHLWFNWFIPLVLYQLVGIFEWLKNVILKIIIKMRGDI